MDNKNIYMCTPKLDIINRERRRKFELESSRVVEKFGKVEDAFLRDLFAEEPKHGQITLKMEREDCPFYFSYDFIYQSRLEEFICTYEWLLRNGKLRITDLNEHYFPQIFKPMEGGVGAGTMKRALTYDWRRITRPLRQLFNLKDLEEEEYDYAGLE